MADSSTTTKAPPTEPVDPEVKRLEKEIARIAARRKLVDAKLGALEALAPGVADAPTNAVILGDEAGSLAPWLAQDVFASVANAIAIEVWNVLNPEQDSQDPPPVLAQPDDQTPPDSETPLGPQLGDTQAPQDQQHALAQPAEPPDGTDQRVVFVTDDGGLLASDVIRSQVSAAITGRTRELAALVGRLEGACEAVKVAVAKYERAEQRRTRSAAQRSGGELTRALVADAEEVADVAAQGVAAVQATTKAAEADAAPEGEEGTVEEPEPAAAGAGPIGAAVDLVRLLATDYTITKAEVAVDSALLARLTAGRLATGRGNNEILLDGFALAGESAPLRAYGGLIAAANKAAAAAQQLAATAAPVVAEADEYETSADEVRDAWTTTRSDETAAAGAAAEIKKAFDELAKRLLARRAAAAPADELMRIANEVIAAARAEIVALASPDSAGITPLQRACSRDRLHRRGNGGSAPVTHVLLVQAAHAGADVVTRRSILGTSGRIGYLGGANGAWVMVSAADGTVVGGNATASAGQMTHDIASGASSKSAITPAAGAITSTDPLAKNEQQIRIAVLVLACALALVGMAATLSVFFD